MIRKTIMVLIGVCFLSASASAAVTFTLVLDATTDVGATAFGNAYNPGDDTFLSAPGGEQIVALSGTDGSLTGGTYNMTGVEDVISMGAGPDGVVYGVSFESHVLHRWANATVPPTTAATGLQDTRNMTVHGTGVQTIVTTAGYEGFRRIDIYGTTDGFQFSLIDSITDIAAYGHTIGKELSMAWGQPWLGGPIIKKIKVGGEWVLDPQWSPDPFLYVEAPLWYDEINGVLFGTTNSTETLCALDARTGILLGSTPLIDDGMWRPTEDSAYGEAYPGGGTFWFGQQGANDAAHVGKFTYTVSTGPRGPTALYLLDGFGTVQKISE